MCRFVTEGDESIPRDAGAGQQAATAGGENAAPADPNLYQKCYDYYMNFYRYAEVIDSCGLTLHLNPAGACFHLVTSATK